MSTLVATFLSTGDRTVEERLPEWRALVARRREVWPLVAEVRYEPGSRWLMVPGDLPGIETGTGGETAQETGRAGRLLSETLSCTTLEIAMQSVADAFAFHRFEGGRERRCLRYGMVEERIWETVRGEPEPWEERSIFRLHDLEDFLSLHEAEEVEALRELCLARRYEIGRHQPFVDARALTGEILEWYEIPSSWPVRATLRPGLLRRMLG